MFYANFDDICFMSKKNWTITDKTCHYATNSNKISQQITHDMYLSKDGSMVTIKYCD